MPEKYRPHFWVVGAVLSLFLAWVIYTPIPFTALKVAAVASALLLFVGVGLAFKPGKWLCLGVSIPLLLCALWPASKPDSSQLRAHYLAALVAYQGTPYVWGGENGRGLDCSGLMRRAMIDALISQGWHDHNPALWREATSVWWHDCSASAMKSGYNGYIEPLFPAKNLNALDTTRLRGGDLAITQSGVHVLAFVGGKTWIQADPNLANGGDKVIQTTAPTKNGWFTQRVQICRWKNLS
ncbi:hypothetical protein IAD21_04443 [Abditibacteriota bacterium]|nr:hypothetical protein IAD21_04443 [Abditibacteriota bacterium]